MAILISKPKTEVIESKSGTFYEALSVANNRIEKAIELDTLNQQQTNELTKMINNFLNNL